MHFYTSVNINYLPKARVLAKSVKELCKNAWFSLVLCDKLPPDIDSANEPFDEIVTIDRLNLPVKNLNLWIYKHSVVELCTAVKGQALQNFLERSEKVAYIDPDIVVYDDLSILERLLDDHDIIFTPHQTAPETDPIAVVDNEVCALRHGSYNFGFYAVRASENGKNYARWFRDRLLEFCYDDKANGLFTDQRWGDIAPALFENLHIWKHPGANVSTWNLTHREVKKTGGSYTVNGEPLLFYHFSGFDSGSQKAMLNKYGKNNPALTELSKWYADRINAEGQPDFANRPSAYNFYTDGTKVTPGERKLIRLRGDVSSHFSDTNPYDKSAAGSYYNWYAKESAAKETLFNDENEVNRLQMELCSIYNSRSWRLANRLKKLAAPFLRR